MASWPALVGWDSRSGAAPGALDPRGRASAAVPAEPCSCHPALSHFAGWRQGGARRGRCQMRSPYLPFSLLLDDCGQGPNFAWNTCFSTCKSGKETQRFLSLCFTKSSTCRWRLIRLSPSFCWAAKLQNEPLQQKVHDTNSKCTCELRNKWDHIPFLIFFRSPVKFKKRNFWWFLLWSFGMPQLVVST